MVYNPATKDSIQQYGRELEVFGIEMANDFESEKPMAPNKALETFIETHCIKRTYFFQVRKCEDPSCTFHKEMRGDQKVATFPDPIPYEDDGVMRYKEGSDKDEKHLPSKIDDPSKRDHHVPFTPSAQTAKNVGFFVRCEECDKPRLIFAKNKLKERELNLLKRMLNEIVYTCGATFSEYDTEAEDCILYKVFVKANLSCGQKVEVSFYSCEIFKAVCIHCGCVDNFPKEIEYYPQCTRCTNLECAKVPKRKRKQVVASDLSKKKKKTSDLSKKKKKSP